MKRIGIIGAGPSGLMATIQAAKNENNFITLFDSNERIGRKLFISGKGRCNLTNAADISDFFEEYFHQKEFLYSALYSFTNVDLMNFFEERGIELKRERGGRIFPKSDKSNDIVKSLEYELKKSNISVKLNTTIEHVKIEQDIFHIIDNKNKLYKFDAIVVATGGKSYPNTGSRGKGYDFAEHFNHKLIPPSAALCGFNLQEVEQELQGLTLKNIDLYVYQNEQPLFIKRGELLFTHFGVSGPLVLEASNYIDKLENINSYIDLKPGIDEDTLDRRIINILELSPKKQLKNVVHHLLPITLGLHILRLNHISDERPCHSLTRQERLMLVRMIKKFPLLFKSLRPIEEGIVTAGGVDAIEINPSTMESKLLKNLYFCGEIIDFHGNTGGYNLQACFSTGFLAGIDLANS